MFPAKLPSLVTEHPSMKMMMKAVPSERALNYGSEWIPEKKWFFFAYFKNFFSCEFFFMSVICIQRKFFDKVIKILLQTWHLSGFIRISNKLFCCSLRKPFWVNVLVDIKPLLFFVFVFSAVMLLFVDCVSLSPLWWFFGKMLLLLLLLLFTDIGLDTFSMLSTINGGLTLSWDGSMVLVDVLLFGE